MVALSHKSLKIVRDLSYSNHQCNVPYLSYKCVCVFLFIVLCCKGCILFSEFIFNVWRGHVSLRNLVEGCIIHVSEINFHKQGCS